MSTMTGKTCLVTGATSGIEPSALARDAQAAGRLWALSSELAGGG